MEKVCRDSIFQIVLRFDTGVLKGLMGQERPVVVDGRNVVDADGFVGAGFVYKGIGRGDRNEHQIKCS
ncbi:MAG: hypothetical protein MIO93_05745 [ANME-2 cluster archaeon]|nr:hypothetical protein [ANME-2 cluster archaeon]